MPLDVRVVNDFPNDTHIYRIFEVMDPATCFVQIAREYVDLRTQCASPLRDITLDGVRVVGTERIKEILASRTVPHSTGGVFDVVRSDMGEVIGYLVLENLFGTKMGYKNVRDRELIQLTGRGIDMIGVETGERLSLLLGETKVSGPVSVRQRHPPSVVDDDELSISNSLVHHISNKESTLDKIWDTARKTVNEDLRDVLMAIAIFWEAEAWEEFNIICCGILVRPLETIDERDFGLLKEDPGIVAPANVRFLIVGLPTTIEAGVANIDRIIHPRRAT